MLIDICFNKLSIDCVHADTMNHTKFKNALRKGSYMGYIAY